MNIKNIERIETILNKIFHYIPKEHVPPCVVIPDNEYQELLESTRIVRSSDALVYNLGYKNIRVYSTSQFNAEEKYRSKIEALEKRISKIENK